MSEAKPARPKGYRRAFGIAIGVLLTPVVIALALRLFVVEAFKVPAGSMIPTLFVGDHMFVSKWNKVPRRGVVFVFRFPENPAQDFVKRVVATSGDTLELLDGRPVVNGNLVPQCYVGTFDTEQRKAELYLERNDGQTYGVLHDQRGGETKCSAAADCKASETCKRDVCIRELVGPFTVKPGEFWVLGDNRDNSFDSPRWNSGTGRGVPQDLAIGTPLSIFLSVPSGRAGASIQGPPKLAAANAGLQTALDHCIAELAASPP